MKPQAKGAAFLIFWTTVFGMAMGFFEAAIVVYLRLLYYPGGFAFPIKMMDSQIALVETLREFCTLVMLLALGLLAGKSARERLGVFLLAFGVWDLVYYLGLKVVLGWPASPFTWDILFLIPIVWAAPVLAAVLSATTMILFGAALIFLERRGLNISLGWRGWLPLGAGSGLQLASFLWDYALLLGRHGSLLHNLDPAAVARLQAIVTAHVPVHFQWGLYLAGEALILWAVWDYVRRSYSGWQRKTGAVPVLTPPENPS